MTNHYNIVKGQNQPKKQKTIINKRNVLFILSLSTWVVYFFYGIYISIVGYDTGHFYKIYGMNAFLHAMLINLIIFTIIPILPFSLIYIISYLLNRRKKYKEKR